MEKPSRRFATMTATEASSSAVGMAIFPISDSSTAVTTNDAESRMNAHWMPTVLARRPAPAKPMAVEPNAAIDRKAFAADSSSSVASSGMMLSYAGSKNCLTPALISRSVKSPRSAMPSIPTTTAMSPTTTAWMRQVTIMIRLRSWRST